MTEEIVFSREQEEVLAGTILGDAYISNPRTKGRKNAVFFMEHSTKQEAYCLWKAEMLGMSHCYRDRYDARTDKVYSSVVTYSPASPTYNEWYDMVYGPDGHKHLNVDVLNKLGPLGLCIWYLDDGHTDYDNRRCIFHTERFTLAEQQIIQQWFRDKWNLNPTIQEKPSNGTMRYVLVFNVQDSYQLIQIISPFVTTHDMQYKITLKPYKYNLGWLNQ